MVQSACEDPSMTDEDYARHLDELDRLIDDPGMPLRLAEIWRVIDALAAHDRQRATMQARNSYHADGAPDGRER
jgi:hypothetical protein